MLKKIKLIFFILILVVTVVRLHYAATFGPSVWVESIAADQTFELPVHLGVHPQKNKRFYVSEKVGRLYTFKEGKLNSKELILDLSDVVKSNSSEEGMLSSVIDPKNPNEIYIYYCLNKPQRNRLSRFTITDKNKIDRKSEVTVLEFKKWGTGHNGGDMRFGEDGMFWLSIGEAKFAGNNDKLLDETIVGSIVRIDVRKRENGKEYAIPLDNPYVNSDLPIAKEVWARGFRNPWRWSFISKDKIIVGDVGDRTHEEINVVKAGDHFGWPYIEGGICSRKHKDCKLKKYNKPQTYFTRTVSRAITGGLYYKGDKIEILKGRYVFADYLRGLMTLPIKDPPKVVESNSQSGFSIIFPKIPIWFGPEKGSTIHPVSFLEDHNKEILMVSLNGGIFRIIPIDFWTKVRGFFYMFGSTR